MQVIPYSLRASSVIYETERYRHLIAYSRASSIWAASYLLIAGAQGIQAGPLARVYMKRYRSILSVNKETGTVDLVAVLLAGAGGVRLVFTGREEPLREIVEFYNPHTIVSTQDLTKMGLCQGKPILLVPKPISTTGRVIKLYFCLLRLAPFYKKYINLFKNY